MKSGKAIVAGDNISGLEPNELVGVSRPDRRPSLELRLLSKLVSRALERGRKW
jgi:hypothetical protein